MRREDRRCVRTWWLEIVRKQEGLDERAEESSVRGFNLEALALTLSKTQSNKDDSKSLCATNKIYTNCTI